MLAPPPHGFRPESHEDGGRQAREAPLFEQAADPWELAAEAPPQRDLVDPALSGTRTLVVPTAKRVKSVTRRIERLDGTIVSRRYVSPPLATGA